MSDQYASWRSRADDAASSSGGDGDQGWERPLGEAADGRRASPQPAVYPRIPLAASPPAPAAAGPSAPRVAVVALVAALIGGLLSAGVAAVVLRRDAGASQAVLADPQPVQAPTVEVAGGPRPTQVEAVAEVVLPTVVQIDIGGRTGARGNGSGVVYRSDGHIITNNHVVAGAEDIRVVFADGDEADAEVVGRDELSDLAVIKVDRERLQAISIGDTAGLRVGQLAVAVGSPFGLEGSVTAGVVSALARGINVGEGIRLSSVIQTDAPINPGNSGGALVGGDGRLIGINSAILTAGSPANAGVGFAIPVDIAVDVADELIAAGEVTYAFLGVEGTDVTRTAASRLGVERGALVDTVQPGTPAADAGLRSDDVIVRIGADPIRSMDDLILAVRQAEVGDSLAVTYVRDGRQTTTEVTLVERPD